LFKLVLKNNLYKLKEEELKWLKITR